LGIVLDCFPKPLLPYMSFCALHLGPMVNAQQSRMITFEAPGADTKRGDNNGTYSSRIHAWGAITGSYQDANNAFHAFLHGPEGKFTTFEVPGAGKRSRATSGFHIADTTASAEEGTIPTKLNQGVLITNWYVDANDVPYGPVAPR
jgi:hypothetical protein